MLPASQSLCAARFIRSDLPRSGGWQARACYDPAVAQELVADLVRGAGYLVLKLVTAGGYRSGGNGLMLEGSVGLLLVASLFFFLYRMV